MSGRFRPRRVGDQIRAVLAELVLREVKDPNLGFVTVTEVRMSPDVQHATVFVSVMGQEGDEEKSMQALRRAGAFLRSELGRRLRLRHTPELHFKLDQTLAYSERIERLIAEEPGERAEGTDESDG
jgi:ribosome-binding factor A